jgi:hypothetical protein
MATNLSSETGLSGQTAKASQMARAFSPANNNRQNMQEDLSIKPEKSGVVKAEESKQTQESATGVQAPAQQNRTVQSAAGMPEVQSMLGNLGIFNINLTAGVNRFVNSAPASTANAQLVSGGTPVFNQATGQWELPQDAKVQGQTDSLVQEKLNQQKELAALTGDMFDEAGRPKTFEQVLKKFGDKNGDGIIDAQEQQWLNEAFGIVNAIRRMKQASPYSAEFQALQQQLSALDRNGIASGLMEALDQYEQIVGKKVAGSDAESYYLSNLLTMGKDELTSEVQKALTQSSGLFGGDYETYLGRELDKSAQEYQQAASEDAGVMQVIKDVADSWMKEYQKEFTAAKDTLNTMFKSSSSALIADLDKLAAEGNKGIQQAKEWFVDTQTLVQNGSKDFGEVIFQALVDSPLGSESKKILKKWLGSTIGQDIAEKGVLASLLDKLATTGYFWTEDANGTMSQVYLTAQQKMDIVRLVNDPNMSDRDKVNKIQSFVEAQSKGMSGRLEQDLGTVVGPIKSGQLSGALGNFRRAMASSMAGFEDSLVQEGYGQTVDAMGRQSDPVMMQASVEQKAQGYLDGLTKAMTVADDEVNKLTARIDQDKAALAANKQRAEVLSSTGVTSVNTNYKTAFNDYLTRAKTPSDAYTLDGKPVTRVEAEWYKVPGRGTPPPNFLDTYAPMLAAQGMLKNLKGATSDPDLKNAYAILLRDYFGGDEAKVNAAIAADIFTADAISILPTVVKAMLSTEFASEVWKTTKNSQALQSKIKDNDEAIAYADAKIQEAILARRGMQQAYDQAVKQLGMTTAQAKKAAASQPVMKLDASNQTMGGPIQIDPNAWLKNQAPMQGQIGQDYYIADEKMRPGENRASDGSLYRVDESGQKWLSGWSGQAVKELGVDPTAPIGGWVQDTRVLNSLANPNASVQDLEYAAQDFVSQIRNTNPEVAKDIEKYYREQWPTAQSHARNDMYSAQSHMNAYKNILLGMYNMLYDRGIPTNTGTQIFPNLIEGGGASIEQAVGHYRSGGAAKTLDGRVLDLGVQGKQNEPLRADISGETANNMFNQAIQGQVMPFTAKPVLDESLLKGVQRVNYAERGKGLSPDGLGQYVDPKWVADDSRIAASRPIADVGKNKAEQPAASPVQLPTPKPATQADTDNRRTPTKPDVKITKITETDNPNTVLVTTSDGKQTLANVAQTPKGPVIVDASGGLNPMYPPAGVQMERLPTDPNAQQQPEQKKAGTDWFGKIMESLTPGIFQPSQKQRDEQIATNTAQKIQEQAKQEAAKQGAIDARFGGQRESGQLPEYYAAYDRVVEDAKAKQERQTQQTPKAPEDNNKGGDTEKPTPSGRVSDGPQRPRQDPRNI